MSEKRMRRVRDPYSQYGDESINVDPEECWKELRNASELDRISYLSQPYYWDVILEDLDGSPEEKEHFKSSFFTDAAAKNRSTAIYGSTTINNTLGFLVVAARAYETHQISLLPDEGIQTGVEPFWSDDDGQTWDNETIGRVFSRLLCIEGLQGFADNLSLLAKAEVTREKNISEGRKHKIDGLVWRAFCGLVLKNKSLPTQGELFSVIRERWGSQAVKYDYLPKICKKLGVKLGAK